MAATTELPVLSFASATLWEEWLSKYHAKFDGVWIKTAKKATGIASVAHEEALDVALCYGWIDGQRKTYDDKFFLQKFTPRRTKSLWSKHNVSKVTELIAAGRMQPSGLAEIEAARQDGRWEAAYDSSKNMAVPEDFLKALNKNKQALTFFNTLSKSNVYAIAFRLETRKRRFDALLVMLNNGGISFKDQGIDRVEYKQRTNNFHCLHKTSRF